MLYPVAKVLPGKVRKALGFDRCFVCYVSATLIEVKILEYFFSVDIPILELFRQSECTGPHATNSLSVWKIGTVVGRPLPGTTTKLDPDTGEIVYTRRHIFAGYLKMEDKTKEAINPEGFLHSGDVVSIDDCLKMLLPISSHDIG